MRRPSKLQISQPALYFSAGIAIGVMIGAVAGYLARGIQTDDRDIVIQQDIWNPRGQETDLETLLDGSATEPRPTPSAANEDPWQDSDLEGSSGAPSPSQEPGNTEGDTQGPSNPFALPDEPGPSPANPSEDSVDPGGLRLSDDPTRSYDAPDP